MEYLLKISTILPINHKWWVYKTGEHVQHSVEQIRVVGEPNDTPDHELDQEGGPVCDGLEVLGDRLKHTSQQWKPIQSLTY